MSPGSDGIGTAGREVPSAFGFLRVFFRFEEKTKDEEERERGGEENEMTVWLEGVKKRSFPFKKDLAL